MAKKDKNKEAKTTVVTVATSGLGRATALQLTQKKVFVVSIARSNTKPIILIEEIEKEKGGGQFIISDLSSTNDTGNFCGGWDQFLCDNLHPYADKAGPVLHNIKVFNLCLINKKSTATGFGYTQRLRGSPQIKNRYAKSNRRCRQAAASRAIRRWPSLLGCRPSSRNRSALTAPDAS